VFTYKPAWLAYSGGTIQYVYCAGCDVTSANVSSIGCYQVAAASASLNAWATNNTVPINLTSASVVNNTEFLKWYPSGNTSQIMLFQYNPVSKRIYVVTRDLGLMHIFRLTTSSNDFSAWFNTANRETQLSYVKTLVMAGAGAPVSSFQNCHITVEFDQNTGNETCICYTRDSVGSYNGNGSVSVIQWVE
jgi:hypothetical protein